MEPQRWGRERERPHRCGGLPCEGEQVVAEVREHRALRVAPLLRLRMLVHVPGGEEDGDTVLADAAPVLTEEEVLGIDLVDPVVAVAVHQGSPLLFIRIANPGSTIRWARNRALLSRFNTSASMPSWTASSCMCMSMCFTARCAYLSVPPPFAQLLQSDGGGPGWGTHPV